MESPVFLSQLDFGQVTVNVMGSGLRHIEDGTVGTRRGHCWSGVDS